MTDLPLVKQLRDRARTHNGTPVGAGDGDTYIPGSYGKADADLDRRSAAVIEALHRALREALAEVREERDVIVTSNSQIREGPNGFEAVDGTLDEAAVEIVGEFDRIIEDAEAALTLAEKE